MLNSFKNKGYDTTIAINVDVLQLEQEDFIDNLMNYIEHYKINRNSLELEITESSTMQNINDLRNRILKLKSLGFKIYLDDFGTGYSSLSYLQSMPIDTVKIDKSFVDTLFLNENLTPLVIKTSHILNKTTVAEGVESLEQVRKLSLENVDYFQGYIFDKPLDYEDVLDVLSHRFYEDIYFEIFGVTYNYLETANEIYRELKSQSDSSLSDKVTIITNNDEHLKEVFEYIVNLTPANTPVHLLTKYSAMLEDLTFITFIN